MSRQGAFIRYWFPLLLWAALIFWGSTDLLSNRQTARFIGPVLRWLVPDLSDEAVSRVQYGVRKAGHVAEYAILAFLMGRAMAGPAQSPGWSWRRAGLAFTATVAYAISDELHQALVSTRFGSVQDVFIDAAGAALGLAARWVFERKRTRR